MKKVANLILIGMSLILFSCGSEQGNESSSSSLYNYSTSTQTYGTCNPDPSVKSQVVAAIQNQGCYASEITSGVVEHLYYGLNSRRYQNYNGSILIDHDLVGSMPTTNIQNVLTQLTALANNMVSATKSGTKITMIINDTSSIAGFSYSTQTQVVIDFALPISANPYSESNGYSSYTYQNSMTVN